MSWEGLMLAERFTLDYHVQLVIYDIGGSISRLI
jgi:hypothetical protein